MPGETLRFSISPEMLDPAEAYGHGYAALGNAPGHTKFWDTFTVTTTEPENTTVTQHLMMYGQGAIIAPPASQPMSWDLGTIQWPGTPPRQSTLVQQVLNAGNVDVYPVLSGTTLPLPIPEGGTAQAMFRVDQDTPVAGNNASHPVTSVYGPFDRCDTAVRDRSPIRISSCPFWPRSWVSWGW